jgi:hypothetical protein
MILAGDKQRTLAELHALLGYGRLGRVRAKIIVFLGLLAAGGGLFLSAWALSPPVYVEVFRAEGEIVKVTPLWNPAEVNWPFAIGGLALFVLGGYLALAGHRCLLDSWSNEWASILLDHLERLEGRGQVRGAEGITASPPP